MAVITFSREAHSGTQDLARRLAERLGYRFVSRDELTRAVTVRSGIKREAQNGESEGRSLSIWEQLGEQLTGEREAYVAALRAEITELALADNVVIVGHGAGQFLTDMRSVVRVFVVASVDERLARMRIEGVDDAGRARKLIDDQDRESAEYLRYLFGIDWLDPHHWDLVINSARADPDSVLDMLVGYTESLVRDRGESAELQRQRLVSRLEQALIRDDLGVDHVSVRFDGSTLVMEGEALAQEDRDRAEAIARGIAPGATLDNRILLHPPTSA